MATVYGEGESRGNAVRVIWSGMQTEDGSRDKLCRSCPRPTNAKGRRRLVKSWNPGPGRNARGGGGIREWWVGWSCRLAFVDPRDPGRWAKMTSPLHQVDAQMRPPPGCQAQTPTERRIRLGVRQTGAHLYETRQVSSEVCSLLINHAEAPRFQGLSSSSCPRPPPTRKDGTPRPTLQPSSAARNKQLSLSQAEMELPSNLPAKDARRWEHRQQPSSWRLDGFPEPLSPLSNVHGISKISDNRGDDDILRDSTTCSWWLPGALVLLPAQHRGFSAPAPRVPRS